MDAFACEEDMKNSKMTVSSSWMPPEKYKVRFLGNESIVSSYSRGNFPEGLISLMDTVLRDYGYLIYDYTK